MRLDTFFVILKHIVKLENKINFEEFEGEADILWNSIFEDSDELSIYLTNRLNSIMRFIKNDGELGWSAYDVLYGLEETCTLKGLRV